MLLVEDARAGMPHMPKMQLIDLKALMAPLMEIFAGGEEVVQFAPVGPEDVAAAEQEMDYVNHVFMQQNPGFLVLYSFIKDALLSKVGVVSLEFGEIEGAGYDPKAGTLV